VQTADLFKLDRASMWTAFNYVANQAQLKYSFMIKDIRALRTEYASSFAQSQTELEAKAAALVLSGDRAGGASLLAAQAESIATQVLERWWRLSEELYVRYNDGYYNTPGNPGQTVFYPAWWLRLAGYEEGPRSYTAHPAK
jgi:dipeptidase